MFKVSWPFGMLYCMVIFFALDLLTPLLDSEFSCVAYPLSFCLDMVGIR
jgi:hypothetical protein